MSYEKHTWETGETITAEKLNNLEQGIASVDDVVVVHITEENDILRLIKRGMSYRSFFQVAHLLQC